MTTCAFSRDGKYIGGAMQVGVVWITITSVYHNLINVLSFHSRAAVSSYGRVPGPL